MNSVFGLRMFTYLTESEWLFHFMDKIREISGDHICKLENHTLNHWLLDWVNDGKHRGVTSV